MPKIDEIFPGGFWLWQYRFNEEIFDIAPMLLRLQRQDKLFRE